MTTIWTKNVNKCVNVLNFVLSKKNLFKIAFPLYEAIFRCELSHCAKSKVCEMPVFQIDTDF